MTWSVVKKRTCCLKTRHDGNFRREVKTRESDYVENNRSAILVWAIASDMWLFKRNTD